MKKHLNSIVLVAMTTIYIILVYTGSIRTQQKIDDFALKMDAGHYGLVDEEVELDLPKLAIEQLGLNNIVKIKVRFYDIGNEYTNQTDYEFRQLNANISKSITNLFFHYTSLLLSVI